MVASSVFAFLQLAITERRSNGALRRLLQITVTNEFDIYGRRTKVAFSVSSPDFNVRANR